jgi:hypothetical protein
MSLVSVVSVVVAEPSWLSPSRHDGCCRAVMVGRLHALFDEKSKMTLPVAFRRIPGTGGYMVLSYTTIST